jgi:hypothetical protein
MVFSPEGGANTSENAGSMRAVLPRKGRVRMQGKLVIVAQEMEVEVVEKSREAGEAKPTLDIDKSDLCFPGAELHAI